MPHYTAYRGVNFYDFYHHQYFYALGIFAGPALSYLAEFSVVWQH
jgi:hypothetical protein